MEIKGDRMLTVNFSLSDPVKLVSLSNKKEVVSFPNGLQGRAVFSPAYKHIEMAMGFIGIPIPTNEIQKYLHNGRRSIQLNDQDFGRAFFELYYKRSMNPDNFVWYMIDGLKRL